MIFYRYRINYGNGKTFAPTSQIENTRRVLDSLRSQRYDPNGQPKPRGIEYAEFQQEDELDKSRWLRLHY